MTELQRKHVMVIAAAVLCVAAACPATSADVVHLTGQNRHTGVMVSVPPCPQPNMEGLSQQAGDFLPFSSNIIATVACREAAATANSWQESDITTTVFTATGGLENTADSTAMAGLHSISFSFYEVTFDITDPAAFQLVGSLAVSRDADAQQMAAPRAEILLTGPGGEIVLHEFIQATPNESQLTLDIDTHGLLSPGSYTWRVRAEGIIDAGIPPAAHLTANFDTVMHVNPAIPGDLNGDGVVDGADLGILLANWGDCDECDDCIGDINGDCVVDGADLGILLANWG